MWRLNGSLSRSLKSAVKARLIVEQFLAWNNWGYAFAQAQD